MKKLILLITLLATIATTSSAQDVYTEMRKNAQTALDNPATDNITRQFSQFKVDALDYMGIKMRETMPDSTVAFLDKQAYALNQYMSLYMKTLLDNRNQPAAYQVKLIKLFMDASYSNPLFFDSDKELVLAYFADGKSLTRFSLDTDWRRALYAVMSELKKNK